MRFAKEVFKQMGEDLNNLIRGYWAVTAYLIATVAVMTLTTMILINVDYPITPAGQGIGALVFLGAMCAEILLSYWLWDAGTKAKTKIAKENRELLKSIENPGETNESRQAGLY